MNSPPLIIIPTVNEGQTIRRLCVEILATVEADILVVDDASQDQTREELQRLANNHPGRFHTIYRQVAAGIGTAYLAGFRWALAHDYPVVIQMDGDGSHQPCSLIAMIEVLQSFPLVVGSRYVAGARVEDTLIRRCFSRIGNFLVLSIIPGPIRDMTSGFNGWQSAHLNRLLVEPFFSHGHAFQMELKTRALQEKMVFWELPITFKPRASGKSKLRLGHFWESLSLLRHLGRESRAQNPVQS